MVGAWNATPEPQPDNSPANNIPINALRIIDFNLDESGGKCRSFDFYIRAPIGTRVPRIGANCGAYPL